MDAQQCSQVGVSQRHGMGFDAYSQIENQDISMQLEASHLDGLG